MKTAMCKSSGKPIRVNGPSSKSVCCPTCSKQVPVSNIRAAKGIWWYSSAKCLVATIQNHDWKSIQSKTYFAGQLSCCLEIVHVGGDVYQFEKTLGGEFRAIKGTISECILRAEMAEKELVASGFERPLGYQGGQTFVNV